MIFLVYIVVVEWKQLQAKFITSSHFFNAKIEHSTINANITVSCNLLNQLPRGNKLFLFLEK